MEREDGVVFLVRWTTVIVGHPTNDIFVVQICYSGVEQVVMNGVRWCTVDVNRVGEVNTVCVFWTQRPKLRRPHLQPQTFNNRVSITVITRKAETATSARHQRPPATYQVTSSIKWPFDSPYAVSYRCSIVTVSKSLSPATFEILGPNTC